MTTITLFIILGVYLLFDDHLKGGCENSNDIDFKFNLSRKDYR
jgi:hypothetical protein